MHLVATLGPASGSVKVAGALVRAGATQARLNASHLDAADFRSLAQVAWRAGFDSGVVDLQGGKTRIQHLDEPLELRPDQARWLAPPGCREGIGVDRRDFLGALKPGDRLRVDDGRFTLQVVEIRGEAVRVVPSAKARLKSRKGLALVGREAELPDTFLQRDVDLLQEALKMGITEVAISYATPGLCAQVRDLAGEDITVVAKVERPSAVHGLAALEEHADTLWLCRGDLGAEAGLVALPALQQRTLQTASLPLLVAGQVLHHMTLSPRPTRAEVCHVADLVRAGAAGFVLSDETAVGPYGPHAVEWLARLGEAYS